MHFLGGGLADDQCVVERFKALVDGDIRPWPGEERRRGRAERFTAIPKAVKEMRPDCTEIVLCMRIPGKKFVNL